MTAKAIEVVRGSGNVFADFGYPNAAGEQLKALLAAQIINVLDRDAITVRRAGEHTGIAAADFSRIRQVKLDRFTIDRLTSCAVVRAASSTSPHAATTRRPESPSS